MTLIPKPRHSTFNDRQWEAIHTTGSNLLISASAGSGKTTVLIERIYQHLMKEYATVDQLLVVTFTELAALEMKVRMEERLKQAISAAKGSQRYYLSEQLRHLPQAHIQTLHSFCLSVIQEYFYLIDFDPSFTLITDETQNQLLLEEVWDELVHDIVDQADQLNEPFDNYLNLLSRFSTPRDDAGLFEVVLNLHYFASSHPNSDQWLREMNRYSKDFDQFAQSDLYAQTIGPWIQQSCEVGQQYLQQALQLLETLNIETIEKYEGILQDDLEQIQMIEQANASKELPQLIQQLQNLKFTRWAGNRKKSEDYEAVEELKSYRDQTREIITNIKDLFTLDYDHYVEIEQELAQTIASLAEFVLLFRSYLTRKKRSLNQIDYNDLEHLTLQILAPINPQTNQREASVAAINYQEQFKELLIDEYQDINELQAEILYWLSRNAKKEPEGNQFMVGDVKQSIYGFRLADPSLFIDKYETYAQDDNQAGQLIILDQNYRSRPEILNFTNFVFKRIMDKTFGEINYGEDEALKVGVPEMFAPNDQGQYDVELLLHCQEDNQSPPIDLSVIESKEEAQAHLIAQDIVTKMQQTPHYTNKKGDSKPLEYSDFVILAATRHAFPIIERVFAMYQLPLNTQNIDTYFKRHEIQLMLSLLKIIDNPKQDLPLVAILRSYFVQIDDEALSWIRIQSPTGNFYDAVQHYVRLYKEDPLMFSAKKAQLARQLDQWLTQLSDWQQLSKERSLVELIWTIYQETNFLDYVAGLTNGAQRVANLHAFYERAANFTQQYHQGLFGFVQYIEKMMQREQDLAEPQSIDPNANYIQLMTVHGSKGLEFPYVYLIQTEKQFNLQDVRQDYIASKDYGVAINYSNRDTMLKYPSLVREAIKLKTEMSLKAEEMRKLYVAFTRAEYKLMIVGTIESQSKWTEDQNKIKMANGNHMQQVSLFERLNSNCWLRWVQASLAISDASNFKQVYLSTYELEEAMQDYDLISQQNELQAQWWVGVVPQLQSKKEILDIPLFKEALRTHYDYELATKTSSYQSVSELKRLYEEPAIDKLTSTFYVDRRPITDKKSKEQGIHGIRYTEDTFEPPQFIQQKKLTAADKGTLTHYFLQQLDFNQFKNITSDQIEAQLIQLKKRLIQQQYLTKEMAELIDLNQIQQLIEHPLGQQLTQLTQPLHKEQAFSYLIPARHLFDHQLEEVEQQQLNDDQILIHGIIDGYYVTDQGLVLFDYKTNRYRTYQSSKEDQIQQLIETYRFQLSLYAQALSVAKDLPIAHVYLVLLDFNEVVEIDQLYQF